MSGDGDKITLTIAHEVNRIGNWWIRRVTVCMCVQVGDGWRAICQIEFRVITFRNVLFVLQTEPQHIACISTVSVVIGSKLKG